ncbi:MAG: hypothetical protein FWH06_06905 [Oscillospiraceae bacterium]|nr:hypothetical protein [Oscillospiraceae bacterium]
MVSIEQVERLLQYADISYEEARDALETANGSLLDAIVLLERQGRISKDGSVKQPAPPAWDASAAPDGGVRVMPEGARRESAGAERGGQAPGRIGELFDQSLRFMFVVYKRLNGAEVFRLPVWAAVILTVCFFWVVIPFMMAGLLFGLRYRVENPDAAGSDSPSPAGKAAGKVNETLDDIAGAADALVNEFRRGFGAERDAGARPGDMPPDIIDVDYTPADAAEPPPEPPKSKPCKGPERI